MDQTIDLVGAAGGRYVVGCSGRWETLATRQHVLFVVHTMTGAARVQLVAELLAGDPRIQVVFTAAPDDLGRGVETFLDHLGAVVLPWRDVVHRRFDLAVAVSYGELEKIRAPVVVMPHGAGHHKLVPRQPGAGPAGRRGVYGYDREQLVRNGRVVAAALVLSHVEQRGYLAEGCPEAVPAAAVVGDPCHDQIADYRPEREAWRRRLGVEDGQRLVVVSSTWGRRSLWGQRPDAFARILAGLPEHRYRVAAVLHPNIVAFHGRFQVERMLADCRERGLVVVDPVAGWQPALAAADWVVGDHGSVTLYATLSGAPVLLAAYAEGDIDPRSPVADLSAAAPRLDLDTDLATQLDAATAAYPAERHTAVARRITSEPGRFARNMRGLLYRSLGLDPPGRSGLDRLPWRPGSRGSVGESAPQ